MSVRVLAVGKKHEAWVQAGIERFGERLRPPFDVLWELVPHSQLSEQAARQEESARLLKRLSTSDFVLLLDERGKNIDSPALSRLLSDGFSSRGTVTVIIGGAYGVNEQLRERADFVWSLSKLVFPHQLVRLVLSEQVYRAQEIFRENPYHHR